MIFIGLLITLLGFGISVLSLALHSTGARLTLVFVAIAVSLFGILGVVNKAYVKNAPWKRG